MSELSPVEWLTVFFAIGGFAAVVSTGSLLPIIPITIIMMFIGWVTNQE